LPAAKIRQPLPGDTVIDLTEFVPGSRISVYGGDGAEIGDGGGPQVALTRPILNGETITVVQRLGECQSDLIYVIEAGCSNRDPNFCSSDWPTFRHSGLRDGQQPFASALSDPVKVRSLRVVWDWSPPGGSAFRASPIVYQGRVFIGNSDGRLYALDAASGALLWQYPRAADPALVTQFLSNASSRGLAASAAIALLKNEVPMVVFGAPDQSIGAGLGSGRVFALEAATGNELWKSGEIARLTGLTYGDTSQLHEQFGYSAPLVLGRRIFLGIANHGDNPIQNGRVAAVDVDSGNIVPGFGFLATSTRGGGVWSAVAGGLDRNALFIATGNARCWNPGVCQPEPKVDHSLSLLRLRASSGSLSWKLKPVPFDLDGDPDWASGPTLLPARCGNIVASTQKDGWSYAAYTRATGSLNPALRWQFPPTGMPFASGNHGDTRYLVPGAAWQDSFITMTGGYTIEAGHSGPGFGRLHALDTCASPYQPVRWIADIPATAPNADYRVCRHRPRTPGGVGRSGGVAGSRLGVQRSRNQ
jgi:outer membrane protein assembly factor BamB